MIPIGFTTMIHLLIIIIKKIYDFFNTGFYTIKRNLIKIMNSKTFIIFVMMSAGLFIIANVIAITILLLNPAYSNLTLIKLFFNVK